MPAYIEYRSMQPGDAERRRASTDGPRAGEPMVLADPARSIARMLSKMDAEDRAAFNECIFMARGFRPREVKREWTRAEFIAENARLRCGACALIGSWHLGEPVQVWACTQDGVPVHCPAWLMEEFL